MTDELRAENERLKAEIAALKGDTEELTVDQQIAEAEQAGDWGRSLGLKAAKAGQILTGQQAVSPTPETPEVTDETVQAIAEAEQAGDWGKVIALKLQASGQGQFIPRG